MADALDLSELLPAHYRRRDEERGRPLRALLGLLSAQGDIVRHGTDAFWDDLFIETCDRWVIPYIGELVGNNPLHDVDRSRQPDVYAELFPDLAGPDLRPPLAVPLRADVAKTIYYRRRKGTAPMLEELARDVTGWGAKMAEFFELLEWYQNDDHLRFHSPECAEVRHVERIERAGGPFDIWAHTPDVRRIAQVEGWHNIKNVGFFLWRLRSYPLDRVPPRPVDPNDPAEWRFHVSPLGNPAALYTNPRPEGDASGRATELHVPAPVRRAFFYDDLVRYQYSPVRPRPDRTDLYGPLEDDASFLFWDAGVARAPAANPNADPAALVFRVVCRRLDPWPATAPLGNVVAFDPANGRLALGQGFAPAAPIEVSYHYGFSADMGGGPYERRAWLAVPETASAERTVGRPDPLDPPDHPSVIAALNDWVAAGRPDRVITIRDNRTYPLPAQIVVPWDGRLVIQAANQRRPLLVTPNAGLRVSSTAPPPGEPPGAALTISGVVVEGHVRVIGDLGRLRLLHATLVPGRHLDPDTGGPVGSLPSLVVEEQDAAGDPINRRFRLEAAFAITGGLRVPAVAEGMWIYDSIVDGARVAGVTGMAIAGTDGDSPGPRAFLERVTIFGESWFRELPLASEVIFDRAVTVERRQGGCVRFSYVRPGSTTPRRFRCQPDLAVADARERAQKAGTTLSAAEEDAIRRRVVPRFTDFRYGQPGYAQLSLGTPVEIRTGAEDGSEMGAFAHLHQPQRETNLRIRLREYLPFGLVSGLIYVT